MSPLRLGLSVVVACIAIALAQTSFAEEADAAKAKPDEKVELVVGDVYAVTVEVDGVKEPLFGELVKVTDEWLVLGFVMCFECDLPKSPFIPYWAIEICEPFISREALVVSESSYYKYYHWAPRASATITKRVPNVYEKGRKNFVGDSPTLDIECSVDFVEEGTQRRESCDLLRIKNGKASLVGRHWDFWSEVPILGYLFVKQRFVEREELMQVPLDKVLTVKQSVPYDYLAAHGIKPDEAKRR